MATVAWLSCLLVLLVDLLHVLGENVMCGGGYWCEKPLPSDGLSLHTYFHYSPSSGVCVELDPSSYTDCVPATNCTFSSAKECRSVCGKEEKAVETCADTEFGCCVDGVTTRQGQGGCPGEVAPSQTGGGGKGGGHWGVVTSGVCGVLILLGLVALVALSTFAYRRRRRQRNRWYIHEVLQMYDGGDSSDSGAASDSSWDDPEHKNLFDRL